MGRGIANDQRRMVIWATHHRWVQKLLDVLSQVPPPGYAVIVRADKELFLVMAREAAPPYKVDATGPLSTLMSSGSSQILGFSSSFCPRLRMQ